MRTEPISRVCLAAIPRGAQATIQGRVGLGNQLVQAVRDREVDVALVGLSELGASDRLQSLPLLIESLVAVLPEGHELAARESVTLGQGRLPVYRLPARVRGANRD
jgi:DNA-binding transcriptional LysR family regulator